MELDLSYNCLMEHSTLWVLNKILTLFWISLEGNPLSYHLKHRQLSIQYLSTCEVNYILGITEHSNFLLRDRILA